jgi:hypothetical protein
VHSQIQTNLANVYAHLLINLFFLWHKRLFVKQPMLILWKVLLFGIAVGAGEQDM